MLDFGVVYAAPETGKLLADFGADVIRVESRTNPDWPASRAGRPA